MAGMYRIVFRELLLLGLFLMFMEPLIGPLAFGAVLAIALYPIYKLKKKRWFAAVLIFISILVLLYMFYLMSITVFDQITYLSEIYSSLSPETQVRLIEISSNLPIGEVTINTLKSLPGVGIGLLFFVIFSFYFLTDGYKIKGFLKKIMPKEKASELVNKGKVNLNAVVKGVFINALFFIFLSTLILYFTNSPSPLIYSIIAGIFGLLPILSSPLVYGYLVYLKLVEGSYVSAVILVVFQLLWLFVLDYVVKAKYRGTLHPAVLLGSMIAGLYHFGFSGIVIGPLLVTIVVTLASVGDEAKI